MAAQYAQAMSHALARAVSILGHPMVVLPGAAVAVALSQGQRTQALWMAAGFALFAVLVMGWSWWQVRRGAWAHVDASQRQERRTLNRFLLLALLGAALVALVSGQPRALALGLALAALLIAVAQLAARWCKLSLHLAFVAYAAVLLGGISVWAGALAALFGALVAWSRLALARHVPRDLWAGAIAGAAAGLLFWWLSARLPV